MTLLSHLLDTSKSKDADNDDTCHMCQMEEPTGVRTKEVLWIQCGKCQHWYHQYVFLSRLHLISNL